jgi:hypothetical protein
MSKKIPFTSSTQNKPKFHKTTSLHNGFKKFAELIRDCCKKMSRKSSTLDGKEYSVMFPEAKCSTISSFLDEDGICKQIEIPPEEDKILIVSQTDPFTFR